MAKKYYAVAVGKIPGIYTHLGAAKEQIANFSGSVFRGFNILEDAENYINVTRENLGLEKIEIKVSKSQATQTKIYVVLKGKKPGIYTDSKKALEQTNGFSGGLCKKVSTMEEAEALLKQSVTTAKKKTKTYVVIRGHNPGIYDTLEEAKEQMKGYTNPEVRSFSNREKAEEFVASVTTTTETTITEIKQEVIKISRKKKNKKDKKDKKKKDKKKNKKKDKKKNKKSAVVYVDGSYNQFIKKASYACVIVSEGHEEYLSGSFDDLYNLHNVSGELKAAMRAMEYCVDKKIKKVTIYYDFAGIETFCDKDRKTSKDYIKSYKKYVKAISEKIEVSFEKVKAHSGDKYNEIADKLAKHALMLCA